MQFVPRPKYPLRAGTPSNSVEPIYGLVAIGAAAPDRIVRNSTARKRDVLILTKPLGVGIFSAALKRGVLGEGEYTQMLFSTTQLNSVGAELAQLPGVHAMTDVTGFGLLGHALEMCRGASVSLRLNVGAVPAFPAAVELAQRGIVTGASKRNWDSYGSDVVLPASVAAWRRDLLCDPQTSGGLLIACERSAASTVLELLRSANYTYSSVIGEFENGPARIHVSDG